MLNVLNIHNPSIEVHLAGDQSPCTGAAVIVAPGGGHQILWVGPEGADFIPFFKKHGVATIILRNRLRVDGYDPKTDAVNDAFQAIRLEQFGKLMFKVGLGMLAPGRMKPSITEAQAVC
jgi:endo-1,4-beta-xylanase